LDVTCALEIGNAQTMFHSYPIVIADEKARVGVEPTVALVLSQGGLPIAYRAMLILMPKAGVGPAIARV
jgi:hypothetical protein